MADLYYNVAGHTFVLRSDGQEDIDGALSQYNVFQTDNKADVVFSLRLSSVPLATEGFAEELRQDDEGQTIVAGRLPDGFSCFEFWLADRRSAVLVARSGYTQGEAYVESAFAFGVNNAIMVMYALATANKRTALFHSSVVSYRERGYMFLGVSGTGKSTHSRLWLRHIEGTELVNDDNPVVRILDNGEVRVYGSPWSGKTPCYRNISFPLGALVMLSQAPRNEMVRLKGVMAYAALLPSISGKRWDKRLVEGLHETENLLAQLVPVWHLDCLPDRDAALLCCKYCTDGHD